MVPKPEARSHHICKGIRVMLISCPYCAGWTAAETGMMCDFCGGDGVIWDEQPEDGDFDEGFDAGEWNNTAPEAHIR